MRHRGTLLMGPAVVRGMSEAETDVGHLLCKFLGLGLGVVLFCWGISIFTCSEAVGNCLGSLEMACQ